MDDNGYLSCYFDIGIWFLTILVLMRPSHSVVTFAITTVGIRCYC